MACCLRCHCLPDEETENSDDVVVEVDDSCVAREELPCRITSISHVAEYRGHFLIYTALTDIPGTACLLIDGNPSSEDEYLSSLCLDSDVAAGLAGSVTDSVVVVADLEQLYTRSLRVRPDVRDCQLLKSGSVEFLSQQLITVKNALSQQSHTS